ncbi:cytochrome c-type biogenesis protein [Scopulibacillus daqui]|uniref:Cytochrome c-type biogenesis protein n=1 Tax=Scopulibacillus daqui TaxID=1469162 RepID=A0ABS2PZF1_9BACL|nr:cytochrome c biogenesis protein CcdA [Scopulibacillus daqui]MBM7644940.1 cytochrome c-type biogenesis protein [Scopulibacillus daqui]
MANVNIFIAFGAGLLSFVSPCSLPLYPAYLSYITGISVDELKENNGLLQRRAWLHTLFFLAGFSLIFIALGLSSSFIGGLFHQFGDVIRQAGAILIIFFGVVVVGWLKPSFLMKDRKISFRERPSGFLGSMIIGMGFAAGWTPCTGPILAAVIALGVTHPSEGLFYMMAYVLGFAVPFIIFSFFIGRMHWIKTYSGKVTKIGGYIMIVMGIFLYFNWMTKITSFLVGRVFGGFTGL